MGTTETPISEPNPTAQEVTDITASITTLLASGSQPSVRTIASEIGATRYKVAFVIDSMVSAGTVTGPSSGFKSA